MENDAIMRELERMQKDIETLFSRTNETREWQAKFGEKIENINTNISELKDSICKVLELPQRRWEAVVAAAISALVGGAIGAFIMAVAGGIQ